MTTHLGEKVRLVGWGTFEDLQLSIRARLFGELVKRATPVVKEYESDLFHDANWLTQHVNGPCTFDWLVRDSGTNISLTDAPSGANAAVIGVQIGAPGGVFYRVELVEERGQWSAIFTWIPLDEVLR